MSDASGDITIVFNGEIYNVQSIREEFEKRGHRFKTRPDTEWGEDVVDRPQGTFAIFDRLRDRLLLLLRDRVGKKPLFYAVINKHWSWAAGIPEKQRSAGRGQKSLLKRAMEPYLPKALMYRSKMGFGLPIDMWLQTEMRDFAYDTLLGASARSRGLFVMDVIRHWLDRHCAGENLSTRIWALLMLELWFRMRVNANLIESPAASDARLALW